MLRRINMWALAVFWTTALVVAGRAQTNPNTPTTPPTPPARPLGRVTSDDIPQEQKQPKLDQKVKDPTGEQVAELVIYTNTTSRGVFQQIRRNGVERGRLTRLTDDGRTEEVSYEQRFVHGETAAKDKLRLDQKTPTAEYALVYSEGQLWGIINGTAFTPRQEAAAGFLAQAHHGLDALLRYKENGSTVTFVSQEKQKNIDMWVVDLTDKDQQRTRYYVSRRTGHVLELRYTETPPGTTTPVNYRRTFHDYRVVQNTLVPYRTVLYADDRQVEEARVLTVTYGIKMDDAFFQNPQQTTANSQ